MSKNDLSVEAQTTSSSFVQVSFSRFGKNMDKTSFNVAKKSQEDEKSRSANTSMGHIVIIYPGQEQKTHWSGTDFITTRSSSKHQNQKHITQPSAAFNSVPREVKQRSRIFEQEKSYENKYQPRWELIKERAPSYSFKNSSHLSSPGREDEHLKEYKICVKNPVLRWAEGQSTHLKTTSHQASKSMLPEIQTSEIIEQQIEATPQSRNKNNGGSPVMSVSAQQMNEYDIKLESLRRKANQRYALKFSRQTKRKPLAYPSINQSEDFLNNFHPFSVNPQHAHLFNSNQGHELYNVKPKNLPSYDLIGGVNYEQLYPRNKRGHVKFPLFRDKIHLKSDRDGTPPNVKVSYNPELSISYLTRKNPINFDAYSPRKTNVFPKNGRAKVSPSPDQHKFQVSNIQIQPNGMVEVMKFLTHTSIKT